MMTRDTGLRLGARIDAASGNRLPEPLTLEARDLTTHGVIVGMTGSGKTGLGVVLLEEILGSGRPALILDPKGDLANLALLFPDLAPADFRPWVDGAEARREGLTEDELAVRTAERWRAGLADWSLGGDDIGRLRDAVSLRVYTPGSTAGAPIDLIGSLAPPEEADEEAMLAAAEGFVSGLLTLAGLAVDPLTSPEHILLANIVMDAWRQGRSLTLEGLIASVQSPPFRKLGVFEVDQFVPPAERMKLALRLNGLVASPGFAAWRTGDPLDLNTLLWAPDGRPRASIVQLSHLSDVERMFVVTLLLSRTVAWMRGQPGTSDLRALVYIDELFGFAPPTAAPPSKKPLLTLFKQARAHGLGVVVATQNPVDVDYKLMSNAGTWMIGRLTTQRDKARIVEALKSADGSVDVGAWDARIGGLGKRQFLLKQAGSPAPEAFTSRWAMAYLRGPVTRAELGRLSDEVVGRAVSPTAPAPSGKARAPLAADESPVPPKVADGVPVRYVDPAAPWAKEFGIEAGGDRLEAGLAARVHLLFDEDKAGLRHEEVWEAIAFPLGPAFRPEDARPVDFDDRDFGGDAPGQAVYALSPAPIDKPSFFRDAERALADWLYRTRSVAVLHNSTLGLYSRIGEMPESFRDRCMAAAEDGADEEAAKLRKRYETKLKQERDQAARAERRVRELEVDVGSRKQQEMVAGAGELLGMFLGGRRRTRSLSGAASRRSTTRRTEERLRSAEDRLRDELEDVERLESQLAGELEAIWERWQKAVWEVEQVDVTLEKNDIRVDEVGLIWGQVRSGARYPRAT
jgi:hypothetical protein